MGTVLLARHGETTWNREGRIQGWADATLTDRGREQTRALADRLGARDLDQVVASDLVRTRETVETLRDAGVECDPSFSRAWRERDFGEYQGLTRTAIAARHRAYHVEESLLAVRSVPRGESLAAFDERVREGWERLRGRLAVDETALVVTHGGPIRAVLAAVNDRELADVARECSPSNCGVTVLEPDGDRTRVRARDDCAHL